MQEPDSKHETSPLHPAILAMLDRARAAGVPALSAGAPGDARALMGASRIALGAGPEVREARRIDIPTRGGPLPALLLLPDAEPCGLCLYLHGGGWMIGSAMDFEALARTLAIRSGCAFLVPDYRLVS
ncbi:alpha/beta hydrolase fold domain-containing protein [Roseomonas marmotae]|uniref:Alpha/beta hydrolase fold domain-containing protein n=1 Tax=Roseomonas marmotae TaxID=2768161 RepID=A0ABS3KHI3_9PROT|nr:alpha/beta hydrolase fold domain-containing protein [Roseomonas marmotae]MBO1076927.1 alpha/beta hydrolase fold domain-containing protein [Roseomonas marmotae]